MTPSEKNLLILFKGAIRPGEEMTPLTEPVNWGEIFNLAIKQNSLPLVYDSAARYPELAEFEEAHSGYFTKVMGTVAAQMRRTAAFLELYRAFLKAGVSPITLKGIVLRSLYGDLQDYRPSGDEDLLIEKHNFKKAEQVLLNCGYEKQELYADKDLNLIQEVTYRHPVNGLTVELHINPFGNENDIRRTMDAWFQDVFDRTDTLEIEGVPIRTMSITDNFLFIVFHAFKHFTYTGFGVRMMIDVLLFAERYQDKIDWGYVEKGLASVNATRFFADLIILGNEHFGFNLQEMGEPTDTEALLGDMLTMGTFGNTNRVDATADRFINMAIMRKGAGGKSKVGDMLRVLFPSWEMWKYMKPFLVDKPYLLPIEWFKRIIRYLSKRRSGEVDLSASREVGERRVKLLEKFDVI